MTRATLEISFGNLLLSLTSKNLSVCYLRTDVASGELLALREGQLETPLSNYQQIKAAGLALVRFAELLS
jgi:hypothetical protein